MARNCSLGEVRCLLLYLLMVQLPELFIQINAHMQIVYNLQPYASYALPCSQSGVALQVVMCIAASITYRAVTKFESS